MSKKFNGYAVGEIWYDHAGNECSYRENGTLRVTTLNNEPSLTIQSEKDACDINQILAKFKATGLMTNIRKDTPMFGDFSNISDYQTAVIRAQEADEAFMTLPAAIRARFSNDPGELIDFLGKSENLPEAIKLGLVDAPQDSQIPQGASAAPSKEGEVKSPASTST